MPKGPGMHFRQGISLIQLFQMFPDDAAAERWFINVRWPNGIACPRCGSVNINTKSAHKTMPFRCRDCHRSFSAKTNTPMHASNLGYQVWITAIFLMVTNLKGVSSLKLHRDLGISQSAAWYLGHRIRCAFKQKIGMFKDIVEVDETYIGGQEKNKHTKKKLHGKWREGKTTVIGAKERQTKRVTARVIDQTDEKTLHSFIEKNVEKGTDVYTDGAYEYRGIQYKHEWVNHSQGEYVRGDCTTNGIESFWAGLKRGYTGTYHYMSKKHLFRYVDEFVGRQNVRRLDTIDQMIKLVKRMENKRLQYKDLLKKNNNL